MKKFLFLLLISFISFRILVAQTNELEKRQSQLLDKVATSLLQEANLPGISLAIRKGGKTIYSKAYGFSDIEKGVKLSTETRLRTASLAKVITATALGKLMKEGKVNLDEPIRTYVPYVREKYSELTLRQLAGHTSGLAHRPNDKASRQKQYNDIKETVNLMDQELIFEPNTAYKYSTHAFNLIAAAIEGASGMAYSEYLKKEIFEPLGLENTWPENISQLNDNDASLYYQKKGKLKKEKVTNDSYKIPGASFRTTPENLVSLMDAYRNDLLGNSVVSQMFQSNTLTNGTVTQVGIAWRCSIDGFGHEVKEHAGSWRGARTVVVYYPKEELAVSVMTNTSCSLLIEEVAHVFAEISRTKESETEEKDVSNKKVLVKVAKGNESVSYKGVIEIADHEGSLTTDSKGFLQSCPIISLKKNTTYAHVNPYGVIILDLNHESIFSGKGYMYYSMNKKSPRDAEPYLRIIEK